MQSRKELLSQSISLLVKLSDVIEQGLPDYYSSSDLIAELDDFFKEAEQNPELAQIISNNYIN